MKRQITIWLPILTATFLVAEATAQPGSGRNDRTPDYAYEDYDRYAEKDVYRHDDRPLNKRVSARVVRRIPPAPTMRPGRAPSPAHVWVGPEFIWQHGRYRPVSGYWTMPPRRNLRYVPGYWQPVRGGYVWMAGYWTNSRSRPGWY